MASTPTQPAFLWNGIADHSHAVAAHLSNTKRFICMVAFAKSSGFSKFKNELEAQIEDGMSATFVIGVNFYQSEPGVLKTLLKLKGRGDVEVYMGNLEKPRTFHPKLYFFEKSAGASVIVGSANMTAGGLIDNHELSVTFDDRTNDLGRQIEDWIDRLVADSDVVEATEELIENYASRHRIYSRHMIIAQRHAERAAVSPHGGLETLVKTLHEMRADRSNRGFERSVKRRESHRMQGLKVLKVLASGRTMQTGEFLAEYERLIATMHSSGLHRGKTIIAQSQASFREGIRSLLKLKNHEPKLSFETLKDKFNEVDRAGTNVITEILHIINNEKFAVINKNSVSGMKLANINVFPDRPTKKNIDRETYANFCQEAAQLRSQLGLVNFTELDALFNYAYRK